MPDTLLGAGTQDIFLSRYGDRLVKTAKAIFKGETRSGLSVSSGECAECPGAQQEGLILLVFDEGFCGVLPC